MLGQICQYLRNDFARNMPRVYGTFQITDGVIETVEEALRLSNRLQAGQYFWVYGSVFNDGVHKWGEADFSDEAPFVGTVQSMRVPPDVVALDAEITDWIAKNDGAINSPYQSESFGGYSYSKGYVGGTAQGVKWQSQFAARLAPWRKI